MSTLKRFVWVCFMSLAVVSHGQVSFTAKANKYEVGENENFTVEFSVNASANGFQPPSFQGFRVLSGPNTSQRTSYDSRTGRSTTLSYSYFLRPTAQGSFTIGNASIEVNGKTYETNPLNIKVVEQAAVPVDPNSPESVASAGVFLKPVLSKTKIYRGEPIVLSYKLYWNLQINSPQNLSEPDFSGFYKELVEDNNPTTIQERYGNATYNTAVVRQFVLIPQKEGRLSLGSIGLDVPTFVPVGGRDFFGRQRSRQVNQELSEKIPTIEVLPLPSANKPSDFSGAVGEYTFDVSLSKTELNADESLTLKVSINGSGNIKLADLPKPELPTAFEAYDPKYQENIRVSRGGMNGSKSNEYLLIPRYGGTYKIPAMRFSFFNPSTKRYETIKSEAFEVTVNGGAQLPGNGAIPQAAEKEGVSFLGKDILTIKAAGRLQKLSDPFFGSTMFYVALFGLLMILVCLIVLGIYLKNRTVDYVKEKQTKASKMAKKQLAKAKKELDDHNKEAFYEALANALWGYFANKLNIAQSKLSKDNIAEQLSAKKVDQHLIDQAIDVLNRAEIARFTGVKQLNSDKDYHDTALMLTQIDRQI